MKHVQFIILNLLMAASMSAQNYNENQIPPYELPDLLVSNSGHKIASLQQWEQQRRNEILSLFEENMYGAIPDFDYKTEIFRRRLTPLLPGTIQEEVMIQISNQLGRIRLNMLLTLPDQTASKAPVFLGLNFHGNHVISENKEVSLTSNYVINSNTLGITNNIAGEEQRGKRADRWPLEKIIEQGYGLATIHCGDIDPDFDDGFKNGVHSLLPSPPVADQWGTLAAWAWGLSRAMDYLESDQRVDAQRVAVIGHSRLGKAALWTGAVDSRFALVISNNSGCGGAALSRRRFGETVSVINSSFPHWFCRNFHQYNDNEDELPVDQHMLVALIAPRPIYVASATEDQWADPKGEFLSLFHASPVYKLFGLESFNNEHQPPADTPINAGKLGYHLRTGAHDLTSYDWEQYLEFAEKHLTR